MKTSHLAALSLALLLGGCANTVLVSFDGAELRNDHNSYHVEIWIADASVTDCADCVRAPEACAFVSGTCFSRNPGTPPGSAYMELLDSVETFPGNGNACVRVRGNESFSCGAVGPNVACFLSGLSTTEVVLSATTDEAECQNRALP